MRPRRKTSILKLSVCLVVITYAAVMTSDVLDRLATNWRDAAGRAQPGPEAIERYAEHVFSLPFSMTPHFPDLAPTEHRFAVLDYATTLDGSRVLAVRVAADRADLDRRLRLAREHGEPISETDLARATDESRILTDIPSLHSERLETTPEDWRHFAVDIPQDHRGRRVIAAGIAMDVHRGEIVHWLRYFPEQPDPAAASHDGAGHQAPAALALTGAAG